MQTKIKTGIPSQEMNRILQVLAQYPEISAAVLYGSRALGTYVSGGMKCAVLRRLESRLLLPLSSSPF